MIIIENPIVLEYRTKTGRNPFREWLDTLTIETKARIQARKLRIEQGNLGDYKSVGHGVCELRLAFGAGYRIYFGIKHKRLVILLAGGDKTEKGYNQSKVLLA